MVRLREYSEKGWWVGSLKDVIVLVIIYMMFYRFNSTVWDNTCYGGVPKGNACFYLFVTHDWCYNSILQADWYAWYMKFTCHVKLHVSCLSVHVVWYSHTHTHDIICRMVCKVWYMYRYDTETHTHMGQYNKQIKTTYIVYTHLYNIYYTYIM